MSDGAGAAGSREPRPLVTVAVPAYNEAATLAHSLAMLHSHLAGLTDFGFELLVVDDGSTDGTGAIAAGFAATHPGVRVVRHAGNRRLGGALRTIVQESRGDYVVTYDADLSYSVDHIDRLLAAAIAEQAQVVVASCYGPGGRTVGVPPRLLARSRAANRWLSLTAPRQNDRQLHTFTGLVRAYDGPWLRSLSLKAEDVDVNVEVLHKALFMRATVVEIPATLDWTGLVARSSRSRMLARRGRWNVYKSLVAGVLFRPFLFPLLAGAALGAVGVVLFALGAGVDKTTLLGAVFLTTGALLAWQSLPLLQSKRYFDESFTQGVQLVRLLRGPQEPRRSGPGREPDRLPHAEPAHGGEAAGVLAHPDQVEPVREQA